MFQKNGVDTPVPRVFETTNFGARNPVLRLTVGSGVQKYGTYAIGTPANSSVAFS